MLIGLGLWLIWLIGFRAYRVFVHQLYPEDSQCSDLVPVILLEEAPDDWVF